MKTTLLRPFDMRTALGLCTIAAAAYACGSSAPTRELVDARRAYNIAEVSPAAQLKPDKLLTAKQALSRAEQAHQDDPGSEIEAHLAYLAQRKAEIAVADAEIAVAKNAEIKADEGYRDQLQRAASGSQAELKNTKQDLASERNARSATEARLSEADQRAKEAEARTAEALKSLAQVATVNEEKRGTVITLSGSVLFPSGNEQLSPIARQSLDRVATVLTEQSGDKQLTVEGYTDSRGTDSFNEQLSQRRADAVRGYLVTRGVPSDRISAVGRGEASPIASNDSPEGRANNRRVEIVIGARQGSAAAQTSSTR